MSVYFNLYWLLLPLAIGLYWWVIAARDKVPGGYLPDLGMLIRLPVAMFIFLLVLCALLGINLWLK